MHLTEDCCEDVRCFALTQFSKQLDSERRVNEEQQNEEQTQIPHLNETHTAEQHDNHKAVCVCMCSTKPAVDTEIHLIPRMRFALVSVCDYSPTAALLLIFKVNSFPLKVPEAHLSPASDGWRKPQLTSCYSSHTPLNSVVLYQCSFQITSYYRHI